MSSYLVPGGSTVQPALVAYRPVTLNANTTLVWPTQSQSTTDFAARVMNVTAGVGPFNLLVPPANQVSTGFDLIVSNVGSNNFNLQNNAGVTIATITPGQRYYFNLTDNTTVGGVWDSFLFGAGSSSLSAAAIAGFGLIATGATLSQNRVINTTSASPINISATDRAAVYIWQGGGGTVNLPAVTSLTNGFFTSFVNEGSGTLTFTPNGADTIDGLASVTLGPNLSLTIHAGTSGAWYTSGKVPAQQFNFTELIQTVTGGTLTETLTQAQNVVQRFIGTLTSNQTVTFPNIVQIYYVQNATAGAFNVTFGAAGGGTSVLIPQGTNAILFSDGTNVVNASNAQLSSATAISIAQGSAAAPSLNFGAATTPDPTTGLFQPVSSTVGITLAGVEAARFTTTGLNANMFVPTSSTVPTNGMFLPAANTIGFATNSTKWLSINSTGNIVNVAPSSGTALTVNAAAATINTTFRTASATNLCQLDVGRTGNDLNIGVAGAGGQFFTASAQGDSAIEAVTGNMLVGANGAFGLSLITNNAVRIATNSAGNVTINAPSSGTTPTVQINSNTALGLNLSSCGIQGIGGNFGGFTFPSITQNYVGTNVSSGNSELDIIWQNTGAAPGLSLGYLSNTTTFVQVAKFSNTVALTLNGATSSTPLVVVGSGTGTMLAQLYGNQSGSHPVNDNTHGGLYIGQNFSGSDVTLYNANSASTVAFTFWQSTGSGTARQIMSLASTAAVTLATPSSGNHQFNGLTQYSDGTTNAEIGWRIIPQNIQNANYTTILADSSRHLYHTSASAHTWTIDSNANVAYPIGTVLTFVNENGGGNVTIAITTDTLRLSPGGTTGSRTLGANGRAVALKVTSTSWQISGTALT